MSEEDEKRIREKAFDVIKPFLVEVRPAIQATLSSPPEYTDYNKNVRGAWVAGAAAECEYWQSKLKERDELLAEMAESIEYASKSFPMSRKDKEIAELILTRYSNLKAK